jgi:hypothetical protein
MAPGDTTVGRTPYVRDQAVIARAASDWYVEHLIKDPMN